MSILTVILIVIAAIVIWKVASYIFWESATQVHNKAVWNATATDEQKAQRVSYLASKEAKSKAELRAWNKKVHRRMLIGASIAFAFMLFMSIVTRSRA